MGVKGKFITFEGIDCAGKSLQIKLLTEYYKKNWANINIITTREPGGCDIAEQIRDIMRSNKIEIFPLSELLLLTVARYEHYNRLVLPELLGGSVVLCDRFFDSTIAYQHYGNGVDRTMIESLYSQTLGSDVKPDLTFILDIDIAEANKRMGLRSNNQASSDRYESKGSEFLHRVREGYLKIAEENKDRCIIINAQKNVDDIHQEIIKHINLL